MTNYEVYENNIINFLKENKALTKFNYNIKKNGKSILYLYNKNVLFKDILLYSFAWRKTPEGFEYWHLLNQKLIDYKLMIIYKLSK